MSTPRRTSALRLVIWIATALFVAMLFYPLIREMLYRYGALATNGSP